MNLPRDVSGPELIRLPGKLGYVAMRQGDDVARDFGTYSALFDARPVGAGDHEIAGQPNVKLTRRR